jgi:16S rRNA G966 N2-methylase RsmD
MNTPCLNRPSTIEYWNKNKKNIKKFSKKMGHDFFQIVNYFNHAPSQFPPLLAANLYKYFNANSIFDPYAGWGDRCLAAMAMNLSYIGIDKNVKLRQPYKKMINFYETTGDIQIIFNRCENVNLKNFVFDFVLTSPPFWRKGKMLERYNDENVEYNDFLQNSLIPVMKTCINRNVWVCLYIPKNMYEDLQNYIGLCTLIIPCMFNKKNSSNIYCWKKKPNF